MAEAIFFSWQADTPTIGGRNFIERSLERALGRLNDDLEIDKPLREELIIDRDTKGVSGQPPIADTIFGKIDVATAFVPDFTFVGKRIDGRPSPNPNVLIEYGWALKSLGHGRIIPVMNTAYGDPTDETLPFDMKHLRRPITYHLPEDVTDETRKKIKGELSKKLFVALKAVIDVQGIQTIAEEILVSPKFVEVKGAEIPSRFRHSGEAIGIQDRSFDAPQEITLASGAACWLRLMPGSAVGRTWNTLELRKVAHTRGELLTPLLACSGFSNLRANDGIGTFVSGESFPQTDSTTFAFETGEVWAVDVQLIPRIKSHTHGKMRLGIPVVDLKCQFTDALNNYATFLDMLGIPRPYRWVVGMEGIKTFGLYYPAPPNHMWTDQGPQGVCVSDVVVEEGQLILNQDASVALMPFFLKLFYKCGKEWPDYLGETA